MLGKLYRLMIPVEGRDHKQEPEPHIKATLLAFHAI